MAAPLNNYRVYRLTPDNKKGEYIGRVAAVNSEQAEMTAKYGMFSFIITKKWGKAKPNQPPIMRKRGHSYRNHEKRHREG